MLAIQKKLVQYNYSKRSVKPKYICIHDTGNPGASALNHYAYFNGGNRNASADFFVDSNNIIQIIDTDVNYSWAVGDGRGAYGITNSNSCSIEMCLESDGKPTEATIQNTIELTKYLMNYYGISVSNVVRHYDASRKSCPNSFKANNWGAWTNFKAKLSNTNVTATTVPLTSTTTEKSNLQKRAEYVGSRCKELQEKLNTLGYSCGAADGIFGKNTEAALLKFQKENGLSVDGYAGPATFAKLDQLIAAKNTVNSNNWVLRLQKELNAQKFKDKNGKTLVEDGIAGSATLSACPTVRQKAKGNLTKLIQEKVGVNADGDFGSATHKAVVAYQKAKGLDQDGIVGSNTWKKFLGL